MRVLLLTLTLLGAGCLTAERAPEPQGTLLQPVTVFEDTIDFSGDPNGPRQEAPLDFPAGARRLDFSAEWSSATLVSTTSDVRIELLDGTGAVLAECDLGTNGVTQAEGRSCHGTMNSLTVAPYTLAWGGFGNVQAAVVVTAS